MSMTRFTRSWWIGLVVAIAALLLLWALPVGSMERSVVARLIGVTSCVIFLWGTFRLPPRTRDVWLLFGAAMALTVIGDVMYDAAFFTAGEVGSPHPTDIPYLLTYVLMFSGLALVLRRLLPGRALETWIDTAIATIAMGSMMGVYILGPILLDAVAFDAGLMISLLYPLADLVVLAVLLRILLGLHRWNAALLLFSLATALFLIADLWYQILRASENPAEPRILEVLWAAALMLYALAVTAPGAAASEPRPRTAPVQFDGVTMVVLIIGVLATPVLLVLAVIADATWLTSWLALANLIIVILLLWRATLLVLKVQRQAQELLSQARADSLTGLPNRRAWDQDAAKAASVAAKTGSALTVAMLDLDHFKRFNDTYGHQAGDALLARTAQVWQSQLTAGDVLARYGGEEFGLLLPGLDVGSAEGLLDQLRRSTPAGTTVSIGATDLVAGENVETAISRADRALYRAKESGRDQVMTSSTGEVAGKPRE